MKNGQICPCCLEQKGKSLFYNAVGIQNIKTVPICKDCVADKYNKYRQVLGEDGGAWALMGELGLPFISDIWQKAKTSSKISLAKGNQKEPFYYYTNYLKEADTIYQGFWDSDTMLDEILGKAEKKRKSDVNNLEEMQKKWGKYDEVEAYTFLEETFNDYTENILEMDTNLINRYKDLCIAEYAKRKAQENGDIQEISRAQDNITKQLKLLKLDDFKQESIDEREKFIDRLCWMIEETEPAEEEDRNKYRDIAGFEEAFREIMRSMRNLIAGTKEYPDIAKGEG